jgi:hypothetical protein
MNIFLIFHETFKIDWAWGDHVETKDLKMLKNVKIHYIFMFKPI